MKALIVILVAAVIGLGVALAVVAGSDDGDPTTTSVSSSITTPTTSSVSTTTTSTVPTTTSSTTTTTPTTTSTETTTITSDSGAVTPEGGDAESP